jgi:Tfp pilus assembly protein PilN
MRAVNLIPAEQRSGAAVGAGRSGGAAYAVVALVAGLALMALLYGIARHQVASREGEVNDLQGRAQRAQQEASSLSAYTTFAAMRATRTQAVEGLVNSRFDWAHVMHEFGRVLPSTVSISSLQGNVGAGAAGSGSPASTAAKPATSTPTSATPPGSVPTFLISGCAKSQTAVADALNRLRLIDGVNEVTLQSAAKGAVGASASGSGGGCPTGTSSYTAQVTFEPLPATSGVAATPTTTNVSTGSGVR